MEKNLMNNLNKFGFTEKQLNFVRTEICTRDKRIKKLSKKCSRQKLELAKLNGYVAAGSDRSEDILPTADRYLETKGAFGNNCNITINPRSGRVTVKYPESFGYDEKANVENLITQIRWHDEFKPFTYRGKAQFYEKNNEWNVTLKTGSKEDQVTFISEAL